MTEEEAKTKWCPFARVFQRTLFSEDARYSDETGSNRWADDEATHTDDASGTQLGSNCIGSACMAWRWDVVDPATYESAPGYCGLAGRP